MRNGDAGFKIQDKDFRSLKTLEPFELFEWLKPWSPSVSLRLCGQEIVINDARFTMQV